MDHIQYSPPEAGQILLSVPNGSDRAALRQHWIDTNLVPVKATALKAVFSKAKQNERLPQTWNARGRQRKLPVDLVHAVGNRMLQEKMNGEVLTTKDWRKALDDAERTKAVSQGIHPSLVTVKQTSLKTACRYQLLHRHLSRDSVRAVDNSQL